MKYITDGKRHLICVPFSIDNLHKMAADLDINRSWYHSSAALPHYDIPKKRLTEIENKCTIVSTREIIKIIRENNE